MIPQSTTLAERLEFYEWALERMEDSEYPKFICRLGRIYYSDNDFEIVHIINLFIELYNTRTTESILVLWNDEFKSIKQERIEALQKAIIEVKRKIEEDESHSK